MVFNSSIQENIYIYKLDILSISQAVEVLQEGKALHCSAPCLVVLACLLELAPAQQLNVLTLVTVIKF